MAFQTDADGNIYDDGQPSPVQITVTPQSKLPVDYGNSGDTPSWVNLDNSQFDQTAFDAAAERLKRGADHRLKLPVSDDRYNLLPSENPTYMMQPDLQNTQAGDVPLPPGAALNDAGQPYWTATGQPVPVVDRPGILPFARTPEGIKLAMPKMLDLASNIVGGGVAAKVPIKAGEMVLGSGIARTAEEAKIAAPFYSQLERSVKDARLEKGNAEQWLGYLKNQPGVKSEEINTVLKELPAGQITKNEMENIVNQNKVELKEKVLGGDTKQIDAKLDELQPIVNKMLQENDYPISQTRALLRTGDVSQLKFKTPEDLALAKEYSDLYKSKLNIDETKYSSYQLAGGENYKEMLLSLPSKGLSKEGLPEGYELINETKAARNAGFNVPADAPDRWAFRGPGIGSKIYKTREEAIIDAQKHAVTMDNAVTFKSSHWDEPNVLAHIRMNDRNVEGSKTLHLEEIQSDWHQKGRKEGYKLSDTQKKNLETIDNKLTSGLSEKDIGNPDIDEVLKTAVEQKVVSPEEAKNYKEYSKGENSTVPDAPFKNNWEELAIKRIIRHAVENGYEGINWEHGNAQALRYPDELRKQVRSIEWSNHVNPASGEKDILVFNKEGDGKTEFKIDKNGTVMKGPVEAKGKNLSEVIGKQMAGNILDKDYGTIQAENFVMGAEGMKSAYDVRIPNKFNEIGKKYGSKVEQKEIFENNKNLKIEKSDGTLKKYPFKVTTNNDIQWFETKENAQKYINDLSKKHPIHYFPITPQLKAKALHEGFPLFSSTPILTPVSHNPFDQQQKQNFKLTPVAFNPFVQ